MIQISGVDAHAWLAMRGYSRDFCVSDECAYAWNEERNMRAMLDLDTGVALLFDEEGHAHRWCVDNYQLRYGVNND